MSSSLPAAPASQTAGQPIPAATLNNHRDNLNYLLDVPRFKVRSTDATTNNMATSGTAIVISYELEDEDSDNGHVTTAGSNAAYTVQTPGLWLFVAAVDFASNGTGFRDIQIMKGGSGTTPSNAGTAYSRQRNAPGGSVQHFIQAQLILRCSASDVVWVCAAQSSGGALAIAAASYGTRFEGVWLAA